MKAIFLWPIKAMAPWDISRDIRQGNPCDPIHRRVTRSVPVHSEGAVRNGLVHPMLSTLIKAFSTLRTDKNRNRYPALTNHRAPHKPLLLFSERSITAPGWTRSFSGCSAIRRPPATSSCPNGMNKEVAVGCPQVDRHLDGHISTIGRKKTCHWTKHGLLLFTAYDR